MTQMHRFSHEAMTTAFDALVIHEDKTYAKSAARAVFDEIDRLERLLSYHDPGTDVGQVNRLKPGEWMAVSLEVLECLEIAARAYVETSGAYDAAFRSTKNGSRPSAMDYLLLSRPDSDEPDVPSQFLVGIAPEAAAEGFDGAEIDLGGIGKGYALDKATILMEDWEIDNYLLNSGTSTVLAMGNGPTKNDKPGKGWPVGVSGDFRNVSGVPRTLLRNAGLSGSGTAVKGEHIRDPQSGNAAGAIAAWVKAPRAAWTDAISTALMIMPRETATKFSKSQTDIAAVVIYPGKEAPEAMVTGEW